MKPPFSYYGGKQRIASEIVKVINNIPHKIYVEPFCGAATILFAKDWIIPSNRDNYREVINDHNSLIYNFFQILKSDKVEDFERMIALTLYSQEEYEKAANILDGKDVKNELLQAWAFYVLINMSFSNSLQKLWWKRGKQGRNDPCIWQNKKENLPGIIERLQSVYISKQDVFECIEQWDSPETLFYLDPPYPNCKQGHYSGYTQEHFEALIQCLQSIKGSFVLSNYFNDSVPDWTRIDIPSYVSASSQTTKRKAIECLWVVDQSYQSLPLFSVT